MNIQLTDDEGRQVPIDARAGFLALGRRLFTIHVHEDGGYAFRCGDCPDVMHVSGLAERLAKLGEYLKTADPRHLSQAWEGLCVFDAPEVTA